MSIIDTLVTDRTGGYYNAADLNRVEAAVAYLMAQFNALPGELAQYLSEKGVAPDSIFAVPYSYPLELETKTDWMMTDFPTSLAMETYLQNVAVLRDALSLPDNTPELPESMDRLTHTGANNIERILQAVDAAALALETLKKGFADNTAAVFVYSGEIYGGEI